MTGLDDLVALDVRSLCESLAMHRPERHELAPGQWLNVVELLTIQLTEGWSELEGRWPTCSAALTYALETAVASTAIDRREKVIRSLNVSAFLLQWVQSNAGVDILSPRNLIDMLFQEPPMQVEEARGLSVDWRALDISQIRSLRAAKNLLSPGLAIAKIAFGELERRLKEWEEVISFTSMRDFVAGMQPVMAGHMVPRASCFAVGDVT